MKPNKPIILALVVWFLSGCGQSQPSPDIFALPVSYMVGKKPEVVRAHDMNNDEFPDLIVSSELFELDKDRYTCSGGTAPMDMMLTLIARERGRALSDRISEGMLCERIRDGADRSVLGVADLANEDHPVPRVEVEPEQLHEFQGTRGALAAPEKGVRVGGEARKVFVVHRDMRQGFDFPVASLCLLYTSPSPRD